MPKKYADVTLPAMGQVIKQARLRQSLTQAAVEAQLDVYAGAMSRWERGTHIEGIAQVRRLCDALDIDFRLCLETWLECEPEGPRKQALVLMLSDFQQVFKRDLHGLQIETLIMGDRRSKPPAHVTDFALQVSISDLFFLAELRRPIHIWFDKLVVAGGAANVPRSFRHHDILMVGSPAVNLASRLVNPTAAFRFHIDDAVVQLEKALGKLGPQLARKDYADGKIQRDIAQVIEGNRGHGFIDPLRPGVSWQERTAQEKGILTFAENPWNPDKLVIVAAGQGGAATAASLQLLAREDCFAQRPLGGIFEVNDVRALDRTAQFEHLEPRWVTAPYTLSEYREAVQSHEHCDAATLQRLATSVQRK